MFVPRQQYPRELKIAVMREIDSGKSTAWRGSQLSAQSQTARGLERRGASERGAGVSWDRYSPTSETGCGAGCRAGAQDRAGGDGDRFFKKSLAAFQGASPAHRRQWRNQLYEQIREAREAEAAVNRLCQTVGVSRAGYYRFLLRPQRPEADMQLRSQIQSIALR